MSIVYSNPIQSSSIIKVGDEFFLRANPKLPKLNEGDIVNVRLENGDDPYGRAIIIPWSALGPNTYRARRTE